MEVSTNERLDFGKMGYGCEHYRRRCKIRAPCCNEVFSCRHCHNKAASMLRNLGDRHELNRHEVKQVICSVCDTEQQASRVCANCGVSMGEYFCEVCKFYDDDTSKGQFHCNECGICRVGGRENFFHCQRCGSCYSVSLRDNHMCVENSMRHYCPICFEVCTPNNLSTDFNSKKKKVKGRIQCRRLPLYAESGEGRCWQALPSILLERLLPSLEPETCHFLNEALATAPRYCCPICFKSAFDMSKVWKQMDEEVQSTAMPEDYRNKKVWILCNDCNDTTEVLFHILGQKCAHCRSYNTRTIAPPVLPG